VDSFPTRRSSDLQFQRALVGACRVLHTEADSADRRPMQPGKALCKRVRFGVDKVVHATLAIKGDVFMAVSRIGLETQRLEHLARRGGAGRRIFDELKIVGAHRGLPRLEGVGAHGLSPDLNAPEPEDSVPKPKL